MFYTSETHGLRPMYMSKSHVGAWSSNLTLSEFRRCVDERIARVNIYNIYTKWLWQRAVNKTLRSYWLYSSNFVYLYCDLFHAMQNNPPRNFYLCFFTPWHPVVGFRIFVKGIVISALKTLTLLLFYNLYNNKNNNNKYCVSTTKAERTMHAKYRTCWNLWHHLLKTRFSFVLIFLTWCV